MWGVLSQGRVLILGARHDIGDPTRLPNGVVVKAFYLAGVVLELGPLTLGASSLRRSSHDKDPLNPKP